MAIDLIGHGFSLEQIYEMDLPTLVQRVITSLDSRQVDRVILFADAATSFESIYPVLRDLRGGTPLPIVLAVEPGRAGPGVRQ